MPHPSSFRTSTGFLMAKLFLILLAVSSSFNLCTAQERQNRERKREGAENFNQSALFESVFDVLHFGATGNGQSDDTQAFQSAWAAACLVENSTVLVPAGHVFLVGPISFSGSGCMPGILFRLEGIITAPTSKSAWKSHKQQWLKFTKLNGTTVSGRGAIDGQGAAWWGNKGTKPSGGRPTALRFYGSNGITVAGITIRNSAQCHLKFDSCNGISVFNFTVSSPSFSVQTDGIHLQNSKNVSIHDVVLGSGDDCVSIQTGCSNLEIRNVACGPGHGISIGGLGAGGSKACVSDVIIRDVQLTGTLTGVRIKTWQGGSGYVNNISVSNIAVKEVDTPILIDQYYCNGNDGGGGCRNRSSGVVLTGISYENVIGTFTRIPVRLACSDSVPCSGISLRNVQLSQVGGYKGAAAPFCWQAHGQTTSPIVPPVGCLLTGAPSPGFSVRGSC